MTLEEKLEHFASFTMEDTQGKCADEVEKYRAVLEKEFAEHKETKLRMEELELKTETERIIRENNKHFSEEQIKVRRKISRRQSELKNKLFEEVEKELSAFRKTPAYRELLVKYLKEAILFARDEKVILYVDPEDAELVPCLEEEAGASVTINAASFMGGMRAVIPGRNILIDNSFETKLAEKKENFRIKGGITHEK